MASKPRSKKAKLEKALLDPEYRMELLQKGDPQLNDIINSALIAVELVFRAASDGAGLQKVIQSLHPNKANHQSCHQ
jgi:hypothetical protein